MNFLEICFHRERETKQSNINQDVIFSVSNLCGESLKLKKKFIYESQLLIMSSKNITYIYHDNDASEENITLSIKKLICAEGWRGWKEAPGGEQNGEGEVPEGPRERGGKREWPLFQSMYVAVTWMMWRESKETVKVVEDGREPRRGEVGQRLRRGRPHSDDKLKRGRLTPSSPKEEEKIFFSTTNLINYGFWTVSHLFASLLAKLNQIIVSNRSFSNPQKKRCRPPLPVSLRKQTTKKKLESIPTPASNIHK